MHLSPAGLSFEQRPPSTLNFMKWVFRTTSLTFATLASMSVSVVPRAVSSTNGPLESVPPRTVFSITCRPVAWQQLLVLHRLQVRCVW